MKNLLLWAVMACLSIVLALSACQMEESEEVLEQPTASSEAGTGGPEIPNQVGTYNAEGDISLSLSQSLLSHAYTQAYQQVMGISATLEVAYIDDDLSKEEYTPYLIFKGQKPDGSSLTFGALLKRNAGSYQFDVEDPGEVPGGDVMEIYRWECSGDPCNSCSPVRGDWRQLWSVQGCDCNNEGHCNHTASGGGLLGVWEGITDLLFP